MTGQEPKIDRIYFKTGLCVSIEFHSTVPRQDYAGQNTFEVMFTAAEGIRVRRIEREVSKAYADRMPPKENWGPSQERLGLPRFYPWTSIACIAELPPGWREEFTK